MLSFSKSTIFRKWVGAGNRKAGYFMHMNEVKHPDNVDII